MKMRKILLAVLLALCLTAAFGAAAFADTDGFNAYLGVTQNPDGSLSVSIPAENAAVLAEKTPTLSIPFDYPVAVVMKDGVQIPCTVADGKVSFVVAEPGVYEISAPLSAFAAYTTDEGCNGSVSNIEIDKARIYVGETVTLTARDALGYRFLGWYRVTGVTDGRVTSIGEQLSGSMSYTLAAEENTAVAAVYQAITETVKVTVVSVNSAQYYIGSDAALQSGSDCMMRLGETLEITAADPARVLQWQNESGKRLGGGATLSLIVTGETEVTLVYAPVASETQSYVQFVSDYGQVLTKISCTASTEINPPPAPSKSGYRFLYWVFEGTNEQATPDSIHSRIGVEHPIITLTPSYERIQQPCSVTVSHVNGVTGQVMDSEVRSVIVGDTLSLHAGTYEGLRFDRWENADGTVLGYKESYYLQASGDVELHAVYLSDGTAAQVRPVITIGAPSAVSGTVHKVSCSATRSIPDGYTLVEHGILYAKDVSGLDGSSFVYGTDDVLRYVSNATAANGVVKLNVKVDDDNTVVSFRGYMLLRNEATQDMSYYYTDVVSASYNGLTN